MRIAAAVLGLEREITVEAADTMSPTDSVRQQNPLGKIPALVLEDGTVLFDSRVICEYLNHVGGGKFFPGMSLWRASSGRWKALGLAALADGVMEAAVGMGMTPRQRLLIVELPLAAPVLLGGVRVMSSTMIQVAGDLEESARICRVL